MNITVNFAENYYHARDQLLPLVGLTSRKQGPAISKLSSFKEKKNYYDYAWS